MAELSNELSPSRTDAEKTSLVTCNPPLNVPKHILLNGKATPKTNCTETDGHLPRSTTTLDIGKGTLEEPWGRTPELPTIGENIFPPLNKAGTGPCTAKNMTDSYYGMANPDSISGKGSIPIPPTFEGNVYPVEDWHETAGVLETEEHVSLPLAT